MTRFERELSGEFGALAKKRAEREIETFQEMVEKGEILIDEDGAARWKSNGRYLPSDCVEKLKHTDFAFNAETTNRKREEETAAALERYRKTHNKTSDEEWAEMRSVFGKGTSVINILTGEVTRL
ncbi:MAG: hypothetical protein IJ899_04620 [Blautia sp.]|nr:hypothetical protein [Blautia sp.]